MATPLDAHDGSRALVATPPAKPSEWDCAGCPRSAPPVAMHHGKSLAEYKHAVESAMLEQVGASGRFPERPSAGAGRLRALDRPRVQRTVSRVHRVGW